MTAPALVQSARRTFLARRPLLMSAAVFAWSTKWAVTLAAEHTTGPELYGVLTANVFWLPMLPCSRPMATASCNDR